MKKNELKKLALLGITGGLALSAQPLQGGELSGQKGQSCITRTSKTEFDMSNLLAGGGCGGKSGCGGHSSGGHSSGGSYNSYNRTPYTSSRTPYTSDAQQNSGTTENTFVSRLDANHRQMYYSLNQEGKDLARQLADQNQWDANQAVSEAKKQLDQRDGQQNGQTSWRSPTRPQPRRM